MFQQIFEIKKALDPFNLEAFIVVCFVQSKNKFIYTHDFVIIVGFKNTSTIQLLDFHQRKGKEYFLFRKTLKKIMKKMKINIFH